MRATNRLLQGSLILLISLAMPGLLYGEDTPIKLGAIASLQGGAAEQGRSWLDGVTLAVEELKAEEVNVKLIVEDDATQASKAVSAFNKLTSIDHVNAVIGGTWDFLGEAIYPIAERSKTFILTPSNQKEILSDSAKKNPYVITNGLSLEAEEKVIEPFLESSGKKTLGIVSVQVPFATAHAEMIKKIATRLGITVVGEVEISLDDQLTAFKLAAQRITKKAPEIIYVTSDYNQLDLFMSELESIKSAPLVLTTQHLEGAFELSKQNQNRYKNCYGVHPKYNKDEFDDRFKARFGHPPNVFAAEGYDAAKFLVISFVASGEGPFLEVFNYDGLKGHYKYKPGQNAIVDDQAVIVHFNEGKLINTPAPL